jgi:hypothetical protein
MQTAAADCGSPEGSNTPNLRVRWRRFTRLGEVPPQIVGPLNRRLSAIGQVNVQTVPTHHVHLSFQLAPRR